MKTTLRSALFVSATIKVATALAAILGSQPRQVLAQGCVASPGSPACMMMPGEHAEHSAKANRLAGTVAYRWYESARHFGGRTRAGVWLDGDEENTDREKYGQEMINRVSLINVTLTYGITERWSAGLDIPYIDAERSSVFEHMDGHRHLMRSRGLGDLRLVTDYWLFDTHKHMNGNVALGIGVKAPTGNDKATDISHRTGGPVTRPVDQSIQPGDGGWGIVLQFQAYQKVVQNLFAYAQGSYLLNPKEHNDTQMVMADMMPRGPMTYNSISDQYFGRAGFNYAVWPGQGVTVSFGGRVEGVPVHDAIGDSLGYRQPGYTVSVEPGLVWAGENHSLSILAPVAVYRNRERSAPEIKMGRPGGDASFADYSILVSFTRRF